MRTALLLAALALLTLSGCNEPPASDPAEADPGAVPGAEGTPAAAETVLAAPAHVLEAPMHLEGKTPVGYCAGAMGTGSCRNDMGVQNWADLDGEGNLTRLTGTLTWTAATPATSQLFAMVLVCDSATNSCSNDGTQPSASGPSPLRLDWDLAELGDQELALWIIQYTGQGTSMGYAIAELPQEFVFDGVLSSTG